MKSLVGVDLAAVLAAGLACWWAAEAQGQEAASSPRVVSPSVDEAALQKVLTNGQALLAKEKGKTRLPSNSALNLFATNQTLNCYASRNGRPMLSALDTQSGRVRWESAASDGTPVVTEGGIELAGECYLSNSKRLVSVGAPHAFRKLLLATLAFGGKPKF
jgi:hypothetical protein